MSPSSQPSVSNSAPHAGLAKNIESRRVSADSTRQMEVPQLEHFSSRVIDVETHQRYDYGRHQAPRESSDDIIKVKQEVREEDDADEAAAPKLAPIGKQRSTKATPTEEPKRVEMVKPKQVASKPLIREEVVEPAERPVSEALEAAENAVITAETAEEKMTD